MPLVEVSSLKHRGTSNSRSMSTRSIKLSIYLLLLSVTLAAAQILPPTPGWEGEGNYNGEGAGGGLGGGNSSSNVAGGPNPNPNPADDGGVGGDEGYFGGESSTLVLAPRRTHRKDPLDGFNYYSRGWNITDRHYWASVAFSATPLVITAAVWFFVFGVCLLIICLCHFCCRREPVGYSRVAYALSLIFLVVFTLTAITGCIVLYAGQDKFHHTTISTLEYLVNQADNTVWKLDNVSNYLSSAKQIGIQNVFLPSNVQTDIDEIDLKLNSSASFLEHQSSDTADDIRDLLDSVRLTLIIISAVMLFLTFLGFLFSMFGMQVLVYTVVVFGWILVTGTFILCGTFLVLHNVASDSCIAVHQWVENPTAHTALDELLPCVDPATSQETLKRSKEVTSQLVDVVNSVISNVSNINFGPQFRPFYYNQSGPLLPFICNPYFHDLTDRPCSRGEISLSNATEILQSYACQVDANEICITTGRLTPALYNQIAAALNVAYSLYNYGPDLISLEDCSFVRDTFTEIYSEYCPGLGRYSKWIYVGLLMVSCAVMLSLIFWVIYGRERKHRMYAKR